MILSCDNVLRTEIQSNSIYRFFLSMLNLCRILSINDNCVSTFVSLMVVLWTLLGIKSLFEYLRLSLFFDRSSQRTVSCSKFIFYHICIFSF